MGRVGRLVDPEISMLELQIAVWFARAARTLPKFRMVPVLGRPDDQGRRAVRSEVLMKLDIRARGLELTPTLRDLVDRRVRYGLSRFGPVIRAVHVTLADVNGPKGGIDKLCRLRLRTGAGSSIVVEQADQRIERALDTAVDRAGENVARQLDRGRQRSAP